MVYDCCTYCPCLKGNCCMLYQCTPACAPCSTIEQAIAHTRKIENAEEA